MTRVAVVAFRMLVAAAFLCCGLSRSSAQSPAPQQARDSADKDQNKDKDKDKSKEDDKDEDENPFAPEPAPTLLPGMTGSDANDPRAKLSPGWYDAGETSMGIKHLLLLKKPDAFQLGASDPDDPKVHKTINQLGIGSIAKIPREM